MTPGRAVFWARGLLAVVFFVIVLFLFVAPKPWTVGEMEKIQDFAAVYLWWAAVGNLVALAGLFGTAPRWMHPLPEFQGVPRSGLPKGFKRVVLGAMVVFAILGGMRLSTSLWDDEEYALRRAILGSYRVKGDTVRLREIPWSHTFWYYTKPTNHVFQSVLSRLSLTAWRGLARPKGLQFGEAAVRLPSYCAGILAVGALALLLAEAGFAWEGALAAWLMALHPWFLRLAPEARGYGLVFLLIPVSCLLAMRAINDGRWRWWAGLAASEFALLLTWPPALMTLLVINVCLVLRMLTNDGIRPARNVLLGRWLVASVAAGMAFFQLFLPCVPQFRKYMIGGNNFVALDFWLRNVGSLFLTGTHWSKTGSLTPKYPELYPLAAAHPVLFWVVVGLAAGLLILGVVRLCRSGMRGWFLAAVFLVAGPVMVVMASLQQTYLYEWYVAFMLPGLIGLVAVGVFQLARGPGTRWVLAVLTGAVFLGISGPGRAYLLTHPAQPLRESVLLTRPSLDPLDPRNQKILTAASVALPEVYDPLVRKALTLEAYQKLMEEADRRKIPLYVNNGFPLALKVKYPEISALLGDPHLFETVAEMPAIEEMLDRVVVRYRPGTVEQADWDSYRRAVAPKVPDSVILYY